MMNKANDIPLSELQFYITAPYPCSYLPALQARSLVADPRFMMSSEVYSRLAQHGFRRSGDHIYRPHCESCQACVPMRVAAILFKPDRSQRRVWKLHTTLQTSVQPLTFNQEHYQLYLRYQQSRHLGGGMDQDDPDSYRNFFLTSQIDTLLVEFRDQGRLVMVSLLDVLADGLSAVYTFFEPNEPKAAYGVFNVLWQLELCRQLELQYVYLGYWVEGCRKMSYKTRYQPAEGLINGAWVALGKQQQGVEA